MPAQWISLAVSVAAVASGMAVNLFIIGRFIGRQSTTMDNIAKTLERVERRVEDVETLAEHTESKRGLMDQRLAVTEEATSKFWQMRDEFTAMRVTVEQEGKHSREKLDSLARGMSVIERQLASMLTTKVGFTMLTSEDKN